LNKFLNKFLHFQDQLKTFHLILDLVL